jgi:hypothetical protein
MQTIWALGPIPYRRAPGICAGIAPLSTTKPMGHKATRCPQFHLLYRHLTRLYKRSTSQSQEYKRTLKNGSIYAIGNQTHDPITSQYTSRTVIALSSIY